MIIIEQNIGAKMALSCSPGFKSVIVHIVSVAFWVCIGLNQYNLENHLPCLMCPEFHACEASGYEEDFNGVSMVQIQDSLEVSILDPGSTI